MRWWICATHDLSKCTGRERVKRLGCGRREMPDCRCTAALRMLPGFPPRHWLPTYRCGDLPRDLLAGLVVGCVLVPHGIAYAHLAGLPIHIGIYSTTVPVFIYSLLGTSRQLGGASLICLLLNSFQFVVPSWTSVAHICDDRNSVEWNYRRT